jgi:threonine/homoserine/homoserine lactone efflux protein
MDFPSTSLNLAANLTELTFVPDAGTMLAYSLACFVLFITPGPDMSLFLAKTLSGGRQAGIAAVLGTNGGCVVHTLLAALGVSALLAASPVAFLILKLIGAVYLLWLAYDAIRNGSALNIRRGSTEPRQSFRRLFLTGLGINLTNPKVVLFFVTFLPQFVSAQDPHAAGKLVFLGLYFVLFNIPLSAVMILSAERLIETLRRRPRILRIIDVTFAGIFGVFALKILATQGR